MPEVGLVVFTDTRSPPAAGSIRAPSFHSELGTTALADIARLPPFGGSAMKTDPDGWSGRGSGTVYLAKAFDADLRATSGGATVTPVRAFGWATAFQDVGAGTITVEPSGSTLLPVEYAIVAVLWLAVLWITRRRT